MFRTIALILSGNLSSAVIMMIRNIVVARFLSLEDYGIASTFVLAVAIVDMMSALGLQQQMVQSKKGNDPYMQSALQGFQLLRGAINCVILMLLAYPLASFFGRPDLVWAYQVIAFVPLISSLTHFDVQRMSRQMNYKPAVVMVVVPAVGSLLLIWPLYLVFGDYRVLLFAILGQYIMATTGSHLMAQRRWRLTLDRKIMAGSLRFGWPFMVNGALMFAVFNGERMIVGGELGLEALALFSMAFSLTLPPALMAAKTAMSFFLPQVSGAQGTPGFGALAMTVFQAHLVGGGLLVLGVALVGGPFIHAVLGEKYAAAIPLLTWLGIMQAIRVWKGGSSVVAMSAGHTENAMVANVVRVLLLPVAWVVVLQGGSLLTVIWIGIGAELTGFVIGLALALWRQGLALRPLIVPIASSMALLVLAGFHATLQNGWMPDLRSGAALVGVFALTVISMGDLRGYVKRRTMSGHSE